MNIKPFSAEAQEFAALESRLEAGDLTLGQIREIEDKALFRLTDEKTRKIGESVLIRAGEKRKTLVDREIVQLGEQSDLGSKIRRLNLLNSSLTPEESEVEIAILYREAPLEEDARLQRAALKQLEHLEFASAEPLAHEFDEEAVESTFSSRMLLISKEMLRQNSLIPFKEGLNGTQQGEIMRYAVVTA